MRHMVDAGKKEAGQSVPGRHPEGSRFSVSSSIALRNPQRRCHLVLGPSENKSHGHTEANARTAQIDEVK